MTEQLSAEGGRLHHHLILNGTGADLEVLRSLWPHGQVELERLDTWQGYLLCHNLREKATGGFYE